MGLAFEIVYAAIDEVNAQLDADEQIEKTPTTTLFGADGGVDSLTIVNLFVAIEQEIQSRTGQAVLLVNEDTLSMDSHPFSSVETLATHVESLIA